jgi:hypothetical protein
MPNGDMRPGRLRRYSSRSQRINAGAGDLLMTKPYVSSLMRDFFLVFGAF